MENPDGLKREDLEAIVDSKSIDKLSIENIFNLFLKETSLTNYKPDSIFQIDPRNGELIVYNASRANRTFTTSNSPSLPQASGNCPICSGKTTRILDVADLSDGFTFINKNMFPIFFPFEVEEGYDLGSVSFGFHFLQWTSSLHNNDWHNMPLKDLKVVFSRLSALEKKLLLDSEKMMPPSESVGPGKMTYGYVSIIKNYGKSAGGSLAHGHQQIVSSNLMPKQFYDNWNFSLKNNMKFTNYLLDENPNELLVKDYGEAVLVVPYFMRRPYDLFLIIKDTSKQYLHELTDKEVECVSRAWQEATRALLEVLQKLGKEEAYNMTVNNGPGAGLYFEFLPFTQLIGGYEKIGLWVCQENPFKAAEILREIINNLKEI